MSQDFIGELVSSPSSSSEVGVIQGDEKVSSEKAGESGQFSAELEKVVQSSKGLDSGRAGTSDTSDAEEAVNTMEIEEANDNLVLVEDEAAMSAVYALLDFSVYNNEVVDADTVIGQPLAGDVQTGQELGNALPGTVGLSSVYSSSAEYPMSLNEGNSMAFNTGETVLNVESFLPADVNNKGEKIKHVPVAGSAALGAVADVSEVLAELPEDDVFLSRYDFKAAGIEPVDTDSELVLKIAGNPKTTEFAALAGAVKNAVVDEDDASPEGLDQIKSWKNAISGSDLDADMPEQSVLLKEKAFTSVSPDSGEFDPVYEDLLSRSAIPRAVLKSVNGKAGDLQSSGDVQEAIIRAGGSEEVKKNVFDSIVSRVREIREMGEMRLRGNHSVSLRLHPKELGDLTIEFAIKDNNVRMVFSAETSEVARLLETDKSDLIGRLKAIGLDTEQFSVDVSSDYGSAEQRFAKGSQGEDDFGSIRGGGQEVDDVDDEMRVSSHISNLGDGRGINIVA